MQIQIYQWNSPDWKVFFDTDRDELTFVGKKDLFSLLLEMEGIEISGNGTINRASLGAYEVSRGSHHFRMIRTKQNLNDIWEIQLLESKRITGFLRDFGLYPSSIGFECLYSLGGVGSRSFLPRYRELDRSEFDEFLKAVRSMKDGDQLTEPLSGLIPGKVFKIGSRIDYGNTWVKLNFWDTDEETEEKIRDFCLEVLFSRNLVVEGELDKMSEFGERVGPDSGDTSVLLQAMGFQSFFQMPNYREWIMENAGAGRGL